MLDDSLHNVSNYEVLLYRKLIFAATDLCLAETICLKAKSNISDNLSLCVESRFS